MKKENVSIPRDDVDELNRRVGAIRNPYKKLCKVTVEIPAEMLETIAGYPDEDRIDRELAFAWMAVDKGMVETYQWLAALIAVKLDYVISAAKSL